MKSVLYRPGSKWPLFAAFAAAVAIHVSALAFTPVHRSETFGSDDFPVVGFEPSPPEPSPEPEDNQPTATTPPPLFESNEYTEEARPTPRRLSSPARPIHSSFGSTGNKSAMGNGKIFTLAAPRPDYPYEARARHLTGSGATLLDVDPTSGAVLSVRLTESTGSPILNNSAIRAFGRWRFKIGTPSPVRIPFTFTMFGAQF